MRHTSLRARVIGWLTALSGALLVLSTLPRVPERLANAYHYVPLPLRVSGRVLTMVIGLLLLFLAGQLGRRKHRAWMIALTLFSVNVVVNVARLDRPLSAALSAVMVILLVVSRKEFSAPPDPPTLFQFVRFLPVYFAAVFLYGFGFIFAQRHDMTPAPSLSNSIDAILSGLVGIPGPYDFHSEFVERAFRGSLLVAGFIGIVIGLTLLFRPIVAKADQGESDWEHASRLVRSYGTDTLAPFALRDDKSFFFCSDGEAMIAYTYIGRYALAAGDPIGRPESIELVIDEFLEMCRERAWGAAFLAVLESTRDLYVDRGLHTFYLGDEAVVHCRGFSLKGKKWKSIRQSAQRVERTYRFEMLRETDASPEMVHALNELSAKWRGKAPERGFTMTLSREVEGVNPDFRLCIALDEHDQPGGFLRIVPVYGPSPAYTLDLMRRDPDTPNGMTEFLLTRTIMRLDEEGIDRLSMNFAAWGRLFYEDIHYSLSQRVAKQMLELFNPFYQIKSLKAFNQRFYPEWVPRVIVYDDVRALPRVGLLFGSVEGFLGVPIIGRYFLPKTVSHLPVGRPSAPPE
jgi:lysylphosphatidylglycerol synthetase-like protein (DUF2156 family)